MVEEYLDEDALEVGSHGDGAELDEKVAGLEARPASLNLAAKSSSISVIFSAL